jgi:hypothetical protein
MLDIAIQEQLSSCWRARVSSLIQRLTAQGSETDRFAIPLGACRLEDRSIDVAERASHPSRSKNLLNSLDGPACPR